MKIFLVEDDKFLNEALVDTFSKIDYEVISYNDGKKAFANIDNTFDLYMIDINLPHINGFELLKQIKFINKNANIFIMSADTNIETILEAYNIGCKDFIKKPFDVREIIAKIEHTLNIVPHNVILKGCGEYIRVDKLFIKDDKKVLKLTTKETLLLDILIKNNDRTTSNKEIEDYVWGDTFKNGHVRQLVAKLRKKIPCDFIENHNSSGYKISVEIIK